jgi:hypothetical protein
VPFGLEDAKDERDFACLKREPTDKVVHILLKELLKSGPGQRWVADSTR